MPDWRPCTSPMVTGVGLVAVLLVAFMLPPAAHAQKHAAEQADTRAQQLFIRGLTQFHVGNPDRAIQAYTEALKLAPHQAAILSALADAHAVQDDLDTAQFFAVQARDAAPSNPAYHRQLAKLYREGRQMRQALAAYERLLAHQPEDAEALRQVAAIYTGMGSHHEALEAYETLNRAHGPRADVLYQMVQLHQQLGQTRQVVERLETLARLQPEEPEPRRLLAEYMLDQGHTPRAIELLEEVRAMRPDDADVAMALSDLYASEGQLEESEAVLASLREIPEDASVDALADRAATLFANPQRGGDAATIDRLLETVLEREPAHYRALVMRGQMRFEEGAYSEAADFLTRALEENPREVEVWFQAALSYLEAGDPSQAASRAEEGLLLFPGEFILLRLAGFSHLEAQAYADALDRLTDAIDRGQATGTLTSDQRSDLHAATGIAHFAQGDTLAAEYAYEDALAADSTNAMALNNYAYSLAEREVDLEDALQMAERAVAFTPDRAAYLDTLGWIHFKLGNLSEARRWIEKAVATGDASAAVHEHLGDVLDALDRSSEAEKHWERAIELDPARDSARQRLNR